MRLDLRVAVNCINEQKRNGTYDGAKIGIVKDDFPQGIGPSYKRGNIILFREYLFPINSELAMGEYIGMKQKLTGKGSVEIPLSKKEIKKQKLKGSLLTTIGTMVNVPLGFIDEVLM